MIEKSLNNPPKEPKEDDNIEEYDTSAEDVSVSLSFDAVKMLSDYITLKNMNSKTNFENIT